MDKISIICRAIVLDKKTKKLLLVRNNEADFWYPPGGSWKKGENLNDCAVREVKEETGVDIVLLRLLYVQQFSIKSNRFNLEMFWLANPSGNIELSPSHFDVGGIVEESRWFSRGELNSLKVFPERIKERFWIDIETLLLVPDLFKIQKGGLR